MSSDITWHQKKPMNVKAVKLTRENILKVSLWCGGKLVRVGRTTIPTDMYEGLIIETRSGRRQVHLGEYVVQYLSGTFAGWDAEAFEERYEDSKRPVLT